MAALRIHFMLTLLAISSFSILFLSFSPSLGVKTGNIDMMNKADDATLVGLMKQQQQQTQELAQLRETVARLEADAMQKAGVSEASEQELARHKEVNDQEENEGEEKTEKAAPMTLGEKPKVGEEGDDMAMPPECKAMWMADGDKQTFVHSLTSRKVQQYIEWGGGGSTLCSSRLVDHVTTIEHNEAWCVSLRELLKATNVTNVNLICSPVDWPHFGTSPEGDGTYKEFQDYVDTIDLLGISHFDAVFIDGRARVACAQKALGYISSDSVVMVHDWQRDHYQVIREWYDDIGKNHGPHREALALLQKKPSP